MESSPNIYELLGVDPSVDQDVLRTAYRARVRVLHPDRGGSPDLYGELKTLNTLWSQVDTPARRAAYDLSRMVEQERAKLATAAEKAAAAKRERRRAAVEEQEAAARAAAEEEQRRQAVAQAAAEAVRRRYASRPQPAQRPPPASPGAPPAGAAPGAPASAPPSQGVDWRGVGEVVADVFRSFVKRR